MTEENLNDLPPDPRSALLGLIGSTFAELKNIDSHLVTKNTNIAGIKSDLNKLVAEANNLVPQPTPQPQQIVANAPILAPIPVSESNLLPLQPRILNQPTIEALTGEDSNQLMFDFYRKITPEDLNSRLADIDIKLGQILEVVNGLKNKK